MRHSTGSNNSWSRWLIHVLTALCASAALVFLILWLVPQDQLKAFLSSRWIPNDPRPGRAHSTGAGINALVTRFPAAFCFFAICCFLITALRRKLQSFLQELFLERKLIIESLSRAFTSDAGMLWEVLAVGVVSGIGLCLRLQNIGRGIRYDEAATYLMFVSKPTYLALSNYSYPNNHLFHTLLAQCSIRLFGDSSLSLRLPALVSGFLAIPMTWLTGRVLYGRIAGILAAGLVAALPTFIEYSVNARGYSLQWLFILAMILCATVLLSNSSLCLSWVGFVLAGVAGIYTIPTMIIPILGVAIWMVLSPVFAGDFARSRQLLHNLCWAGFAVAVLSVFSYFPVLLVSGPSALVSNQFVASRNSSFWEGFKPLAASTWLRWTDGVPTPIVWFLVCGAVLGLVFNHKLSRWALPLPVVLWLWSFVFAFARNILGYPRVWSYLLLVSVIAASAGLSLLITRLSANSPVRQVIVAGVLSILLAAAIGYSLAEQGLIFENNEGVTLLDGQQVVEFLGHELSPGDALVVNLPADVLIDYDLLRRDPGLYRSLVPADRANRVIAVIPKSELSSESENTQTLLEKLSTDDSASPSLAAAQLDLREFTPPRLVGKFRSVTVYVFQRVAKGS